MADESRQSARPKKEPLTNRERLMVAAFFVMAAAMALMTYRAFFFEPSYIGTEKLEIIDETGTRRAILGVSPEGMAGLVLYDSAGQVRSTIGVLPDGQIVNAQLTGGGVSQLSMTKPVVPQPLDNSVDGNLRSWIETTALVLTLIVVIVYTCFTFQQLRLLKDGTSFDALVNVHTRWESSYSARGFVYGPLQDILVDVVESLPGLGADYITVSSDGTHRILDVPRVLSAEPDKQLLASFRESLEAADEALQKVEGVLNGYALLAVPYCEKNKVARAIVKAYSSVFERTASPLVQFVATQRALRGQADYAEHYLRLLVGLKADPHGWAKTILGKRLSP